MGLSPALLGQEVGAEGEGKVCIFCWVFVVGFFPPYAYAEVVTTLESASFASRDK